MLETGQIEIQEIIQESWLKRPFREVFGLSFDGRPIYSPYYSDGKLYEGCDVDVCNGLFIDGEYGYVTTIFHPFVIGCYGPGSNPGFSHSCSLKPRTCESGYEDQKVLEEKKQKQAITIYVVIGCILGLILLGLLYYFCVWKKQKTDPITDQVEMRHTEGDVN